MFNNAPMTQSVAPIGHKNLKLVFPDTVAEAYSKPFNVDLDKDGGFFWGTANQVNALLNPWELGLNGFVDPNFDYFAAENSRVGCNHDRGSSTVQFIG